MSIIETFNNIEEQKTEDLYIIKTEYLQRETTFLCAEAQELQVASSESARSAVKLCGKMKELYKEIEATRKSITEPRRKFINKINDIARSFTDRLDEIESLINSKIAAWKKAEAATLITENEATAALMSSLGIEVESFKHSSPKTIRAEGAVSYEKSVWKFEVLTEADVPRDYLMIDERKIKLAIKAGVRSIPGLYIHEEQQTLVRAR